MKNNKNTCELATHFNSSEHQLSDISFIVIETIINFKNDSHLESLLLTRETYWTAQLCTLHPHGLNKREEFRSKTEFTTIHNFILAWLLLAYCRKPYCFYIVQYFIVF